MGRFKDYLSEMSIAGYGDWSPKNTMISTRSAFVVRNKWKLKGTIKPQGIVYDVYKSPQGDEYICGDFIKTSTDDEIFEVAFSIKLTEHKGLASSFKIKSRLMNVDGVEVKENAQGLGIASAVYKFLVKDEKFVILGDEMQYFGARRLWSRLSKTKDLVIDIIDTNANKYLEKDVEVHHGLEDFEFDERVWSYSDEKKHIRLILKKIY